MSAHSPEAIARQEIDALLDQLPMEIQGEAKSVPIFYEDYPSPAQEQEGVAPCTLGLLEGGNRNEHLSGTVATHPCIYIFLENLYDEADGDAQVFREQVRVTYLHELGHYFGLEEEDMFPRGLD